MKHTARAALLMALGLLGIGAGVFMLASPLVAAASTLSAPAAASVVLERAHWSQQAHRHGYRHRHRHRAHRYGHFRHYRHGYRGYRGHRYGRYSPRYRHYY